MKNDPNSDARKRAKERIVAPIVKLAEGVADQIIATADAKYPHQVCWDDISMHSGPVECWQAEAERICWALSGVVSVRRSGDQGAIERGVFNLRLPSGKLPHGGPAFEKPATGTLRSDAEIGEWAWDTVAKMEAPSDPACCDRSNYWVQLACVMIASSIIGGDEHRLGSILGIHATLVRQWATNLRQNGIWLQDGTVSDAPWFNPNSGAVVFSLNLLLAQVPLNVTQTDAEADLGRHISEGN